MNENTNENIQDISLKEAFEQLDGLIEKMQEGELSLEETFSLYKKGIALVELADSKIEKVECDIKKLDELSEEK